MTLGLPPRVNIDAQYVALIMQNECIKFLACYSLDSSDELNRSLLSIALLVLSCFVIRHMIYIYKYAVQLTMHMGSRTEWKNARFNFEIC